MRIWRKSIQWQLITSMGAALLASILVVVIIFTVALNRLTERYLVDTALPASIEAIRNDIERMLGSGAWFVVDPKMLAACSAAISILGTN